MTIAWTRAQRQAVEGILENHPARSNRCHEAAQEILPFARGLDARARIVKVLPTAYPRARFVLPREDVLPKIAPGDPPMDPWFHHYTTSVTRHYVDALTGPDGEMVESYAERCWQYPDGLRFEVL